MQLSDLPGSSFAMSAHLLPSRLWRSKIIRSSSLFIGSFLMYGSRWLCQLKQVKKVRSHLPFSTLFASSSGYFVLLLESLSNISPAFCSISGNKLYNSVVFLIRIKRCDHVPLVTRACERLLSIWFYERLRFVIRTPLRQGHSHPLQVLRRQKVETYLRPLQTQSQNLS